MTRPEFSSFRPQSLERPGTNDVELLEAQTRVLRAVDYQSGGGTCRDAVLVRIHWGHEMLRMSPAGPVRDRLFSALADLHNLAGWTCFDSGHVGAAHHHFDVALDLAMQGNNDDLVANIHYRRGRIHLHYGAPDAALADFQLGQLAAGRSRSRLAAGILFANQAWAYAKKGDAELAVSLLDRAGDEYAEADVARAPDWARFFTETDLCGMTGTVHTELAITTSAGHAQIAIPALTEAVNGYGPRFARSRSFCLIALATSHFLDGDIDQGGKAGTQAVQVARTVDSVRTKDRMRQLKLQADKRQDRRELRALSDFITAFVTS